MTPQILSAPKRADCDGALPIVVPVGPAHDPTSAVRSSSRASFPVGSGPRTVHIVVINGAATGEAEATALAERLQRITDFLAVAWIPDDVGYIRAVRSGLDLARSLGTRSDQVGFLDADAVLCSQTHWRDLSLALDSQAELDAISGLVIHETCEVWETPSSANFIKALGRHLGIVEKPYIQGGAGGTLARRDVFERSVARALELGTLIGPTLSASAVAAGRTIRATSLLPCRHTPRKTIEEWIESVTAYERSWRKLIQLYGSRVETPWREFIRTAEASLMSEPALLQQLTHSQQLRQQIVAKVEQEEGIR